MSHVTATANVEFKAKYGMYLRRAILGAIVVHVLTWVLSPPFTFKPYKLKEEKFEVVEMADSSVNLVVRPWCNTPDYWAVYFSLQRTIKETLDAEGIGIPFPQMDVHHHGLPDQNA